jgi:iron complex transport system substrate-binding protein
MKKFAFISAFMIILTMVMAACSPAQSATPAATLTATPPPAVTATITSSVIVLTDGLGRTVTLDKTAQRIVSLAPSATETLYAVGAGAQMVGCDSFSDYPAEAKSLTDVGGSMGNYSYETIASLKPDLVVAAEINTADQVKSLEDLGLKVFYIANPKNFDELYQTIQTVGKLTGHDSEALALTDSLSSRVQAVKDTIAKATITPLVFYELDGTDAAKPWTSGPGTFMDQLITLAGGKNVGASLQSSWAQISVEDLIVQNPDIILLGDGAYGITAAQVGSRPGWAGIKAVKDNQIFTFDDNLVSRVGPRLVEGLETLAKLIHPELYK